MKGERDEGMRMRRFGRVESVVLFSTQSQNIAEPWREEGRRRNRKSSPKDLNTAHPKARQCIVNVWGAAKGLSLPWEESHQPQRRTDCV